MEPLQPHDPRRIGSYQVVARLGAGGMGRVYLAISPSGREIAIKLVHPGLAENPEFRARFKREVTAARRVSGAFTAPVVDAEPDAPTPWLATAYLRGLSLHHAVQAHGPLPTPTVYAVGAGLAEALMAIHQAGVVHRDLKPSNVLLTAEGPRVIDFGIARAADDTAVTSTGVITGSPGYMAPEYLIGGVSEFAGDMFALGAVLVYAASGSGPFGVGTPQALLYRVVHDAPLLSDVSDAMLRELAAACLAKDPARRPTPRVVLRQLAPYLPRANGDAWLPPPISDDLEVRTAQVAPTAVLPPAPGTPDVGGPEDPRAAGERERWPTRRTVLAGAGGFVALAAAAFGVTMTALHRPDETGDPLGPSPVGSPAPSTVPEALWRAEVGAPPSAARCIGLAGGLVLAVNNTRVVAVDAATGKERWQAELSPRGDERGLRPVVHEDLVVLQDPGSVSAYEIATGRLRWTHTARSPASHSWPVLTGGLLVVAEDDQLVAYDPGSGEDRWRVEASLFRPNVVAAGDLVYCALLDGVAAYDARTGKRRWLREFASGEYSRGEPIVSAGLCVVATSTGRVRAYAADTGTLRWEARPGSKENTDRGAFLVSSGTLLVQGLQEELYALDVRSGKRKWKSSLASDDEHRRTVRTFGLRPVAAIGMVFVHDHDEGLHALDLSTGRGRWRQATEFTSGLDPLLIVGDLLHTVVSGDLRSYDLATGRVVRSVKLNARTDIAADEEAIYVREGHELLALPLP